MESFTNQNKVPTKLTEIELKALSQIKGGMSEYIDEFDPDLNTTSRDWKCTPGPIIETPPAVITSVSN